MSEALDAVIEVSGLTRAFRKKVALDGVDLRVRRGGVHGLVGENGAGKTTLIKHVLGLLKAKQGTVRVFGTPAEEGGSGKVYLTREGFFDDVDVVLQ